MRADGELKNDTQSGSEQSAHEILHHRDDNCEFSILKTDRKLPSQHTYEFAYLNSRFEIWMLTGAEMMQSLTKTAIPLLALSLQGWS
jgi:hypothetical protein